MKSTLKLACTALVAAGLLAIGGCSAAPSQAIPKSEPTFTPVFKTDAEAMAAAEKDYAGYVATTVAVANSNNPNPNLISQWVTPSAVAPTVKSFYDVTKSGSYEHGNIAVTHFALEDLEQTPSGRVVLTAYVCVDVTQMRLYDQAGADVTPATRPNLTPIEIQFKNAHPGSRTLLVDRSVPWGGRDFC